MQTLPNIGCRIQCGDQCPEQHTGTVVGHVASLLTGTTLVSVAWDHYNGDMLSESKADIAYLTTPVTVR